MNVYISSTKQVQELYQKLIFYYKTKSNCEVDFIVQLADRTRWLIQVCESLDDLKTKEQEVKALNEDMLEVNIPNGIIVTRTEITTIKVDAGKIEVIAAWQFMLNLEQLFK